MKKHSPFTFRLSPFTLLCIPLLLATTACHHEQRPVDVLDANAMTAFLTDLYVVEGCYAVESQYRFDTASPEVLAACDDILKKHNVTYERVEKSFDYYSQHPEEFEAIQKSVADRIEKLKAPDGEDPLK